jgi:beta-lactamase class A
MNRRNFNLLAGLLLTGVAGPLAARQTQDFGARCRKLETQTGGRLGASWLDTGSGRRGGYRSDERFPMCSTFKWLAAAAVLRRVDAGEERLDQRILFGRDALLEWAPVTQHHADGDGMTLAELCEAAITQSDNTAGNLLLKAIGGIPAWNRHTRSLGDHVSRLDRNEPTLNEARVGDVRDTTTPSAMLADLRNTLLGDALSPSSREQLTQWMLATKTSGQRLRLGLPEGWRLADKTGTGDSSTGTANDVGVLWTPSGAPIVLTVFLTQARVGRDEQEAAIATVGRWVRESIQQGTKGSG